jgi:hypothetical protein
MNAHGTWADARSLNKCRPYGELDILIWNQISLRHERVEGWSIRLQAIVNHIEQANQTWKESQFTFLPLWSSLWPCLGATKFACEGGNAGHYKYRCYVGPVSTNTVYMTAKGYEKARSSKVEGRTADPTSVLLGL